MSVFCIRPPSTRTVTESGLYDTRHPLFQTFLGGKERVINTAIGKSQIYIGLDKETF